jgi:hypothetical protein
VARHAGRWPGEDGDWASRWPGDDSGLHVDMWPDGGSGTL